MHRTQQLPEMRKTFPVAHSVNNKSVWLFIARTHISLAKKHVMICYLYGTSMPNQTVFDYFSLQPRDPWKEVNGVPWPFHLGGCWEVFPSSLFIGPIMLQPSCPLRANNLEERTCLSKEVQTYSKVAQEALYVQIPKRKSVKGLRGIMLSKYNMCKSLCSCRSDGAQQVLHC